MSGIIDSFKFRDLTHVGAPNSSFDLGAGLDETAYKFNKEALSFYLQIDNEADRKSFIDVMTAYQKNKMTIEEIDNAIIDASDGLKQISQQITLPAELASTINNAIHKNPMTQHVVAKHTSRGSTMITGGPESDTYQQNGGMDKLQNLITDWNSQTDDKKEKEKFVDKYDDNPILGTKSQKIIGNDRIIFIICTFVIRTISLFLIEWGLNTHMITTFQEAFISYIIGYISLFLVWVLLVNISDSEYDENVFLRTVFYYINLKTEDGLGKFRIGIHIFIQICLIPILYLIKYQKTPIDQDSFEQRQGVLRAISNFTFFIWLMTTIVALQI
jgi:hypothetical protein